MTAQRLYGIFKLLESLEQKLGLQSTLDAIKTALDNLVNQPAQPQYQNTLATSLASFTNAATRMTEAISPSDAAIIGDIGGADFFDPALATKVTNSIQTNAMTPSVARDFVSDLTTKRAAFLATVKQARQSLEKLNVTDADLQPGTADVAFLIPRDIFDNELGSFAKELTFISRLVQDFTEAQTGRPAPVILEQLSSSTPTVALIAALPALQVLGLVINKYLEAWERIEKIRIMRAQLAEIRLKKGKTALDELTEEITTTVNEVVEESTELVMKNYAGNRGDLANAIRSDTRRLFGQIERGLTVEFRAQPQGSEGEPQQTLQQIAAVGSQLKFPKITNEPLLLKATEVLEDTDGEGGGIHTVKHTKTTTTQKTITSKKEGSKKDTDSGEVP
jgi:hypothetical protein